MNEVTEFMGDHIVYDGYGRHDDFPVESYHSRSGTAPPPFMLILYLYRLWFYSRFPRDVRQALKNLFFRMFPIPFHQRFFDRLLM